MRRARLLGHGLSYYHVISRVNHREFLITDDEKERLVGFMREAEQLGCGTVITYCILDNHLHWLLAIDHDTSVPEAEVIARVGARYGKQRAAELQHEVEEARRHYGEDAVQQVLDRYRLRMNNLGEFCKDVLQRFTMSYNRRHGCIGRFWSDRYKSQVVEGISEHDVMALATVAGYIDLNAVRAGIVSDPAKYRFCGYGAAMGGDRQALAGLQPVIETTSRKETPDIAAYRSYIFRQGFDHATGGSSGEAFQVLARKVLAKEGKLTPSELLFCRVRYFSDGVAIGSRNFIEDLFTRNRQLFSSRRQSGARSLRNADAGGLYCMRDLRLNPISPPGCVT